MTSADILAILIGVILGIAAGIPMALLVVALTRAEMKQRQEPLDLDLYPSQIIIIERPMLKDGER